MNDLPNCLVVEPGPPAEAAVIWMHGLGATYTDFLPVLPHLGLSRVRFVFPQAPSIPVALNAGYVMPAWYDIRTLEPGPDRNDPEGIRASAAAIGALVAREVDRGIPASRIVLAGFSQGAAMALYVGLRHPQGLGGLLVLSGYLVLEDTLADEAHPANAATPILFCHGREDEVVHVSRGRTAWERVGEGRVTDWRDYAMGHELCAEQLVHIRTWLQGRIQAVTARP